MRIFLPDFVEEGFLCGGDSIMSGILSIPPAVEDDECYLCVRFHGLLFYKSYAPHIIDQDGDKL
jgi:hypothetical protein